MKTGRIVAVKAKLMGAEASEKLFDKKPQELFTHGDSLEGI